MVLKLGTRFIYRHSVGILIIGDIMMVSDWEQDKCLCLAMKSGDQSPSLILHVDTLDFCNVYGAKPEKIRTLQFRAHRGMTGPTALPPPVRSRPKSPVASKLLSAWKRCIA